jgi:molybdopterin molybdotransferase
MPTALAVVRKNPVLVLSGNPVAAMLGFEVFARPLILQLLGANEDRPRVTAKLTRRVVGVLGRRVFLRARVVERDGEFLAEPVRVKGSGIITTMTAANGYVIIPEDREGIRENEVVTVHLFDAISGEETINV